MPAETEIKTYQMYVGGEWLDAESGKTFDSINPYTGEVWAKLPMAGASDVDRAVRAARNAFEGPWGRVTASERSRIMRQIADAIGQNAEHLARIETQDN